MTGVIANSVYKMLEESDILPTEQKGCKKEQRIEGPTFDQQSDSH